MLYIRLDSKSYRPLKNQIFCPLHATYPSNGVSDLMWLLHTCKLHYFTQVSLSQLLGLELHECVQ